MRMKRITKTALLVMIALAMIMPSVHATRTSAVNDYDRHWAGELIEQWLKNGWASGYADGSFRPDRGVSRAETAAFMNKAMQLKDSGHLSYVDVSPDGWSYRAIANVSAAGWMRGVGAGRFAPDKPMTRQELAVAIARMLTLTEGRATPMFLDIDRAADWSRKAIGLVAQAGVMNGYPDGNFRPMRQATRAETLAAITQAVAYTEREAEPSPDNESVETSPTPHSSSTATPTSSPIPPPPTSVPTATATPEGTVTISKSDFYDKTLAAVIGHIGGTLTGYEFVSEEPLPDSYFEMGKGPYSGRSGDKFPQPQNVRIDNDTNGRIKSDDDYHIDFFNQHILDQHGPNVTYQDITGEWKQHQVSDWGGGWGALHAINTRNMIAPSTGFSEFNKYYWVTESYIENDTLGMVAPGMPLVARDLTEKFASLTGEFDTVTWAQFLSVMYSLAYFETDVVAVMDKASLVLPRNGWPYQLYQMVKELHVRYPDDWRAAHAELVSAKRMVYGRDNLQAIPDINNAMSMLAIEYGGNDYEMTARIASLAGYDAETNASTVMGIMGILKGMEGTPQVLIDTIYANGEGVYINDKTFEPHIRLDYPDEQKLTDIVNLYISNAEAVIVAQGGSVTDSRYVIREQQLNETVVHVDIRNHDFEEGSLAGWHVWQPGTSPYKVMADGTGSAFSGEWKGIVETDDLINEGKLYVAIDGLEAGMQYRAQAYLQASQGHSAQLYATSADGEQYADVVSQPSYYVKRVVEFTAPADGAVEIGLRVPSGSSGRQWASIDELTVERITKEATTVYEAEDAALSGSSATVQNAGSASGGMYIGGMDNNGDYASFGNVNVPAAGEYRLRMYYANGASAASTLGMYVNELLQGGITLPRTAAWGRFADNAVDIPIVLNEGVNTIRLQHIGEGTAQIDYVELSAFPARMYRAPGQEKEGSSRRPSNGEADGKAPRINLLRNGDFEVSRPTQTPPYWGTWPGSSGNDGDADFTERDSHNGEWRLTHWKGAAYEVYTDQTITGLEDGLYTVKAFVMSGGGQNTVHMDAKGFGGADRTAIIPATGYPNWLEIEIANIVVTSGSLQIGFYSNANANNWLAVDDVTVYRE